MLYEVITLYSAFGVCRETRSAGKGSVAGSMKRFSTLAIIGTPEVDLIRGLVLETLVRASGVEECEVSAERALELPDAVVSMKIDQLVFDTTPQALDEHVVDPAPLRITSYNVCYTKLLRVPADGPGVCLLGGDRGPL